MTNKFIQQYNYAEMSVLNVKSIKVTNGENIPLQVSPKGGGGPVTEMQQDRTDMPSHLLSLEKKVKNSNAKIDTSYLCIHCF